MKTCLPPPCKGKTCRRHRCLEHACSDRKLRQYDPALCSDAGKGNQPGAKRDRRHMEKPHSLLHMVWRCNRRGVREVRIHTSFTPLPAAALSLTYLTLLYGDRKRTLLSGVS